MVASNQFALPLQLDKTTSDYHPFHSPSVTFILMLFGIDEATKLIDSLLATEPSNVEFVLLKVRAFKSTPQGLRSAHEWLESTQSNSKNPQVVCARAKMLHELGMAEKKSDLLLQARQLLEELRARKDHPTSRKMIGEIKESLQRLESTAT